MKGVRQEMNKEVKFRGKCNKEGDWYYGYLFKTDDGSMGILEKYVPLKELRYFEVDHDTVGQYIGVDDKNGKEIYEDDIVLSDDGKVGQVQWFEEHLAFMIWCVTDNKVYFAYENDFSKIEVIGNVYENADLLKGEENE